VVKLVEIGKSCPKCGTFFLGNKCPKCGWELLPVTPGPITRKKDKEKFKGVCR
jgi:rRNA maturation protein Nop10